MARGTRNKLNVRAILDGVIGLVKQKQDSVAELLQALKTVRKRAHELPPATAELLVNAVWNQIGHPTLFAAPDQPQEDFEQGLDTVPLRGAVTRERTHFERIVDFFLSAGNRPCSTGEIRRGTGLSRSAVCVILYKTHGTHFERACAPGYQRLNVWKLRDEKFEELANGRQEDRLSA